MMVPMNRNAVLLALLLTTSRGPAIAQSKAPTAPGRHLVDVRSSIDASLQPSYLSLPAKMPTPAPLAVILHTWSFDHEQRDSTVEAAAQARGWILLAPKFRGINDHPRACGSPIAQQDILDAVAWVRHHYPVDRRRIYLLGLSGGGYMTMLMAGHHPEPWAAASAWVGISDLPTWYTAHAGDRYGAMMRACFGAGPAESAAIGAEYRARSPLTYLSRRQAVPLDLAAGRFDSTVAVSHTLHAFQAIAPGIVSDADVDALAGPGPGLSAPTPSDTAGDPGLGRRIFMRRRYGPHRVTVFEGGHEWLAGAAVAWLARQRKH